MLLADDDVRLLLAAVTLVTVEVLGFVVNLDLFTLEASLDQRFDERGTVLDLGLAAYEFAHFSSPTSSASAAAAAWLPA